MTENHNYNTPSEGATDWHIPLNENFNQIDSDIEIRDTEANRSNYTPKSGTKYLSTDTKEVFLGDGSNWNSLGKIGGSSVGTGSTSTYLDPPSTSDTDIDQALANNDVVYIGPGTIEISNAPSIPNNTALIGAGPYATRFKFTDTVRISGSADKPTNIWIEGVYFDGNGLDTVPLSIGEPRFVFARQCRVTDTGQNGGMHIRPNQDPDSHDMGFIDCIAERCSGVSLDCGSTAGSTEPRPRRARIVNCRVVNPTHGRSFTHCVAVEDVWNSVVMGNQIRGDPDNVGVTLGINANVSGESTVVSNTIEHVQNGIHIANNDAYGSVIANNTIRQFASKGIRLQEAGVRDVLVEGNIIKITDPAITSDNTAHGIFVNNGAHGFFRNNFIDGAFNQNGNNNGLDRGIYVFDANGRTEITGNRVRNTNRASIDISGGSSTNQLAPQDMVMGNKANNNLSGNGDTVMIGNATSQNILNSNIYIANYCSKIFTNNGSKLIGNVASAISSSSNLVIMAHDDDGANDNRGLYEQSVTKSGDGSTTTFSINHGMATAVPASVEVTPTSKDAAADFWQSNLDQTDVEITYAEAPPSGTDNLGYKLTARHY